MPSRQGMTTTTSTSWARPISVIAATIISLACGTNYVYSAWAPQFAQKLKLSSTQSNMIGNLGNAGMYASGIPLGMLVDAKGPRLGVALGAIMFGTGYYPLARAFDAGPGAVPVFLLCLFSFMTGVGSFAAFTASIKAAASNYPASKGTATAFPIAAFGLSASFFATVALAFPHDTSHFLLLLATGTVILPVISFPFLRTIPAQGYMTIPQTDGMVPRRTSSVNSRPVFSLSEAGAQTQRPISSTGPQRQIFGAELADDDAASVHSHASSEAMAEMEASKTFDIDTKEETHDLDVRGLSLVRHIEFWQLFLMLMLLSGIGLMTINNIGNDVQALWRHFKPNVDDAFIVKRQVAHVSTLSVCNALGRLVSGIGSDVLVKRYNRSRFWCLFASALLFAVAQLLATFIELPDLLILVVVLTGVAYGMLFGVLPTLTAQTFGVHGLSQNWGVMCLAPAVTGNIFNLLYGRIYDSNSLVDDDGNRECLVGRECYSKAYLVTWTASLAALLLCAWSIYHENQTRIKKALHHRIA